MHDRWNSIHPTIFLSSIQAVCLSRFLINLSRTHSGPENVSRFSCFSAPEFLVPVSNGHADSGGDEGTLVNPYEGSDQ